MFTKIFGAICAFVVLIALLVVGFGSWGTIDAGHRGIVLKMGAVTGEIKSEGFYTKTPWIESVVEWPVQVRKEEVATEAASKDLQMVTTKIALNVNVDPTMIAHVYQIYGEDCFSTFVDPALRESMKAVIAQYTAEELITKREIVRDSIASLVATKLAPAGFKTDAVNIVDFDFSSTFNQAIEAKVTAEQNALAAQNKLSQITFEAQQAVATARGKAESMSIEGQSLRANPQTLQLRALEKWDGHLPQYLGGSSAIPFISVAAPSETR